MARLLCAFGADRLEGTGPDVARFYLLRERRRTSSGGVPRETPESQRVEKAVLAFGREPFTYRGEAYCFQRAGSTAASPRNRDAYEAQSESLMFAVLRALSSEPGLGASRASSIAELLAAPEAQQARSGTTELLLLRRQRAYVRPAEEPAPVTPSQLRQSKRHFVAVEVVDEGEKPMEGIAVDVQLPDGSLRRGTSGKDGLVRIEPAPPGNAIIRLSSVDGSDWRPVGGGARPMGKKGPPRQYTAQQGDTLARIAKRHGLRSWKQVWDAPENEALRKKRKSPHVLHPGDVVSVPGITLHECEKPVDQVHRVIVKSEPKMTLRLNLLGKKRAPLDGTTCKVLVGEKLLFEGPVSGGKIECEVPLSVTEARILVSSDGIEFERKLHIGALDPSDEITGVQARLANMGWFSGEMDGVASAALIAAQNTFRHEQELEPADALNEELFSELQKTHLV